MRTRTSHSRARLIAAAALTAAALAVVPAGSAFAATAQGPASAAVLAPAALTPSDVLASTPWKTTDARDQNGNAVDLSNPAVSNFVGWAYYKADGTFAIYDLDDSPKMHGEWSVSADGSSRTLVAKDANGDVLFTRVVPITVLNADEFTYRVFPNANDASVYYDIVHTPTDHAEPGTVSPSDVLASTPWKTTGARDQNGSAVDLANPAVANFVGWAYYDADGTFAIYNLDDSPKMHGDWSVAADGSTRTLVAKDANGDVLFTRVVPITVLNGNEFTYRVFPNANDASVYYDIVHTPTDHAEPVAPTPSQVLASTPWKTTGARDQNGAAVDLSNPAVSNFVGWAYYKADGTFAIYDLDDSPKMHGDWTVSADGSTRTLVAKDAAGGVLFTRVVPITVLNGNEFTYRVLPNANDASVYYDIVHTPTDHAEPTAPEPTGTTEPTTTPEPTGTTAPAETTTTAPSPSAGSNGGSSGSGDSLAVTGADPVGAVAGGLLALLGGGAVFLIRALRRAGGLG